jgi:hypothetical protein
MVSGAAHAELVNFDLSGGIYTKWLYRNNDSQGVLTYGNPFWPDNLSGDNGVGSEFELGIKGRVGENVEAGARLASRFGSLWQDWWENGDINYDSINTSGESLGLNHAQYIKLRGYYIRASLPISWVDSILVGSSDFGMFNEWTIGKVRFIDRDNGKGVFVQGTLHPEYFRYNTAIIALPKLFVGPGWSTGIGDPNIRNPFWSRDVAYGVRFDSNPADGLRLTAVSTLTRDSEIDLTDPDAVGSIYPTCKDDLGNPVPGCEQDGAVDTYSRYSNAVTTLEAQYDGWDGGSFNVIGGYSYSSVDPKFAANGVALNEGVSPIPYGDFHGMFAKGRAEFFDVGVDGLSLQLEYFNISEHFVTIFGARREADVLLTDGFLEGGQLPTLNLANEFIDFDDVWYESIVGWHGATAVAEYKGDAIDLRIEETFLGYNTNAQYRDVDTVYPTFLHSEGYTDTDLYDYANVLDRGRDPRSVYRRHQDRMSNIAVAQAVFHTGLGRGFDVGLKGKFIYDSDKRQGGTAEDDYLGLITRAKLWLSYPFADGMSVTLGGAFDYWNEKNRRGTPEQGYGDDVTMKVRPYLDFRYVYQGFELRYFLEYVYKDQVRERDEDRTYHVFRSKAELKVAW